MKARVWSIPKYEGQNEDYWYPPDERGYITVDRDRPIVLCDGASESFDSKRWARILANGLTTHEEFSDSWLKDRIAEYEKEINPAELSWSKQLAYERGSFSTFLSLQFRKDKCLINAAGDTEVFLIAGDDIKDNYPYVCPDDFLNRPCLLSTKPELNETFVECVGLCKCSAAIPIKNLTCLLLLTDALAHWLMKKKEDKAEIKRLLAINTDADFREFVETERQKDLRFDDTTMIRIDLFDNLPMLLQN